MSKQIIAIGGGGFSKAGVYSEDNISLARYFSRPNRQNDSLDLFSSDSEWR